MSVGRVLVFIGWVFKMYFLIVYRSDGIFYFYCYFKFRVEFLEGFEVFEMLIVLWENNYKNSYDNKNLNRININ